MILVISLKKFYKYFGMIAIMLFSFYYTEKIALFMRKKDPIYESIEVIKEDSNVNYVNAEIKNEKIIPGINGLSVNTEKSFQKMKSFGAFNKYYLIFDQIKPEISLEDNKDKIITEGNSKKKSISLVVSSNKEIENYLKEAKIKASTLIDKDSFEKTTNLEQINNDNKYFKETDSLLNSINQNKNICIYNTFNAEICKKEKKYLVKPNLELNGTNIANIKSKIASGSIILISSSAKVEDLKLLIKQIEYKGLKIIPLSELIFEQNNLGQ